MENDYKKLAREQFFKYFRIWFILIGILAVVVAGMAVVKKLTAKSQETHGRGNFQADSGRVFDYAGVLTDEEESRLAQYIAECEDEFQFDIVVVTINQDVESQGYWDTVMMDLADDFYDDGNYGYDMVHGDGILILDNWYRDQKGSQAGTWLSTCGDVYVKFSSSDIDRVLTQVDNYIESSPYKAYSAAIRKAGEIYRNKTDGAYVKTYIPLPFILFLPLLIAVIYAVPKLKNPPAKDTTTLMQYVDGGKVNYRNQSDTFLRKNVTSVKIETSSSSGGGGSRSSGGHGGGHVSSGGVSHGGGGHRR